MEDAKNVIFIITNVFILKRGPDFENENQDIHLQYKLPKKLSYETNSLNILRNHSVVKELKVTNCKLWEHFILQMNFLYSIGTLSFVLSEHCTIFLTNVISN